ncbi:50S ribosomal protein L1, chloroplastic [Hondaea fermentalgiana]|uniref:Ribosomal protein n=1 Tax=Hondaea fermentalgiana TaxID=2315210 RepID=A0A2R5GUZ4_9STRA|nr:50S ribosomal protein L1, chloroplastic [Hondaea fermentalgiana]|eukprot:GBG34139.1 50S ribosomal protein L1, chloroplastic [Hondaea fermentalgiana]
MLRGAATATTFAWRRAGASGAGLTAGAARRGPALKETLAGQQWGSARLAAGRTLATSSTTTTTTTTTPPAPEDPKDVSGMPPPDPAFDHEATTDKEVFEAEQFEAEAAAAKARIESEPQTFGLEKDDAKPAAKRGPTPRKYPVVARRKRMQEDPKFAALAAKEKFTPKGALDLARHFLQYTEKHPALTITVELNLDVRKADQVMRTTAVLPNSTGVKKRIAVFCGPDDAGEAHAAGADLVGSDDLLDTFRNTKKVNKIADVVISTPSYVPTVRQIARLLGPKGLMPNEKVGTVTSDLEEAIPLFATRSVEVRTDKFGIVHGRIGTLKMSDEDILANFRAYMKVLQDRKPSGAKGRYITAIYIATGQGPSIAVDLPYGSPTSVHFMRDDVIPSLAGKR